jgi:CubicO group peptidase (beta-lactamase class C family)
VFFDWDLMCRLLARQTPEWEPGTAHGESALFFGHLVGELVRRVDGRRIGAYFRDEIAVPFDVDFAFGLTPAEEARAVELTCMENLAVPEDASDLYRRAVSNPPGGRDGAVVNGSAWRRAEIPAVNGHGTAAALARFYQAVLDGRIISPDLLAEATRVQSSGPDRVMGWDNEWGLGFGLGDGGFGMGGLGGSYAGAMPTDDYVLAFVTGTMGDHARVEGLEDVIRDCLSLPPPKD